jgi:hypothetical protein
MIPLIEASTLALGLVLFGRPAQAHDHHGGESKIPEGETISIEPLVRNPWAYK